MTTDTGWNYEDYEDYDSEAGEPILERKQTFLADYGDGFELTEQGTILALGSHGLEQILDAEIPSYDEVNVDSKVRDAITKWRNRKLSSKRRKQRFENWLTSRVAEEDEKPVTDPRQKTSRQSSIWQTTLRFASQSKTEDEL